MKFKYVTNGVDEMNSVAWVMVTALLGIQQGSKPLEGGGVEFILQLEAEDIAAIQAGSSISSAVPKHLVDVRQVTILYGSGQLPQIPTPIITSTPNPRAGEPLVFRIPLDDTKLNALKSGTPIQSPLPRPSDNIVKIELNYSGESRPVANAPSPTANLPAPPPGNLPEPPSSNNQFAPQNNGAGPTNWSSAGLNNQGVPTAPQNNATGSSGSFAGNTGQRPWENNNNNQVVPPLLSSPPTGWNNGAQGQGNAAQSNDSQANTGNSANNFGNGNTGFGLGNNGFPSRSNSIDTRLNTNDGVGPTGNGVGGQTNFQLGQNNRAPTLTDPNPSSRKTFGGALQQNGGSSRELPPSRSNGFPNLNPPNEDRLTSRVSTTVVDQQSETDRDGRTFGAKLSVSDRTETDEFREKQNASSDEASQNGYSLFFTVLLLFGSIGVNVYLVWMMVGFYRRYRELANELRQNLTSAA